MVNTSELIAKIGNRELAKQILSYLLDVPVTQVSFVPRVESHIAKRAIIAAKKAKNGMPLAYALGGTHFCNLPISVNKCVLVPRNDTEVLVDAVKEFLKSDPFLCNCGKDGKISVLDLCTGSGCIAIALAKKLDAKITAIDICKKALQVAKKNASLNNTSGDITFLQGDLFAPLSKSFCTKNNKCHAICCDSYCNQKFHVIVSNPPYVKTSEIGMEDSRVLKEPRKALDGGEDGLCFYRKIIFGAREYLAEGGLLAVEIGYDQGDTVRDLFLKNGYSDVEIIKDIAGHDRVVIGILS